MWHDFITTVQKEGGWSALIAEVIGFIFVLVAVWWLSHNSRNGDSEAQK
jgi:uncharacterized membrane protein